MRVLYFIYGLNVGGAETLIENIIDKINYEKYKIEFVIQVPFIYNERIKKIVEAKSIRIHYITSYYKNPIKSISELKRVLIDGMFDIIHVHVNALLNITPIVLAKKYNIRIVLHSHSSSNAGGGRIGKILHYINRRLISRYNTVNLACSDEAGRWMFKDFEYEIIYNGIDIDKYGFNPTARKGIRNKYGVKENEFLIGHVGRLVKAKNHEFFIICINEIISKGVPVKAIFVGDGLLEKKIISMVEKYSLKDNVIFAGQVSNVYDYYSAFDLMLFPSIYEGLPFAIVEAQASGIPIVASDIITRQANVTDLVTYISLKSPVSEWNMVIMDKLKENNNRIAHKDVMKKSVFNIQNTVMRIERIYGEICAKE